MLFLPILSTVLSSVTFLIFIAVYITMKNEKKLNGTTNLILGTIMLTQIASIITIWLLCAQI